MAENSTGADSGQGPVRSDASKGSGTSEFVEFCRHITDVQEQISTDGAPAAFRSLLSQRSAVESSAPHALDYAMSVIWRDIEVYVSVLEDGSSGMQPAADKSRFEELDAANQAILAWVEDNCEAL